tara:strand:- start:604 stop:1227 length:624 start_codon:yes stop_codon:yes gene_type:complete
VDNSKVDQPEQIINNTFAVFGADQAIDNSCMLTAMDLLCAQPGRWCEQWLGRIVRSIVADDSSGVIQEWARLRRLDYQSFGPQVDTGSDSVLGAIAVSKDPKTCQTIAQCIFEGIQCIAIDTAELDVIVLSEDTFEAWSGASIQSLLMMKLESATGVFQHAPLNDAAESLFSLESAKITAKDVGTPAVEKRDGDRCILTRSQVVKAG